MAQMRKTSRVLSAQVILKPEAVSAAAATGQVFERAGFVLLSLSLATSQSQVPSPRPTRSSEPRLP